MLNKKSGQLTGCSSIIKILLSIIFLVEGIKKHLLHPIPSLPIFLRSKDNRMHEMLKLFPHVEQSSLKSIQTCKSKSKYIHMKYYLQIASQYQNIFTFLCYKYNYQSIHRMFYIYIGIFMLWVQLLASVKFIILNFYSNTSFINMFFISILMVIDVYIMNVISQITSKFVLYLFLPLAFWVVSHFTTWYPSLFTSLFCRC